MSEFTIAVPFSTKPSNISDLAKAISPRFLNDDIWTILTVVINATCGLDKRLCCLISPLLFIPNSRIAYSVLDGIRARVKGTPQ